METKYLNVKFGADDREWRTSMDRLGKGIENASRKIKAVGKAMTVAGAAVVGAVGLMVKNYVKAGDEVHKMALRTGFTTEKLSELRYAAQISGADLSVLEKGVKRMSKTIVDAGEGMTTYQRAFKRIGVEYEALMGLSPEEQFDKLAIAIAGVEDPTVRAATAQDIFGRAGTQLLPLFAQGVEGLEELKNKAHEMGIVFDQEAADKAARLADAQVTLKSAMSGLSIMVADHIVPAITNFVEKISTVISKFKDWGKEHQALSGMITKIITAFGGLMAVLGPLAMMLPTLIKGLGGLRVAFGALKSPVGLVASAFAGGLFIGNLLRQIPGLDKKIQDLTASFLGLDIAIENLEEETKKWEKEARESGLRFEALKEASKLAGREITNLKEAYEILKEAGSATAEVIEDHIDVTKLLTEEQQKQREEQKKLKEKTDDSGISIKTLDTKTLELSADLVELKERIEGVIGLDVKKWAEDGAIGLETVSVATTEVGESSVDAFDLWDKNKPDMKGWADDNMIPGLKDVEGETKKVVKKSTSLWEQMTDGLQTKWAMTFSDMWSGATNFKDGLKQLWGGVKEQFFDIIGQMTAKWITGFLGSLFTKSTKIFDSIFGTIGNAAQGAAQAASGASSALSGVFVGLGAAVGSFLGSLFNSSDTEYMENLLIDIRDNVGGANPKLDITNDTLWKIESIAGKIRDILKDIGGFQHGGYVSETQLALVHGGEYVLPPPVVNNIAQGKPSGIGGVNNFSNYVSIYAQQLDDRVIHQAGEKIFDEMERQRQRRGY